VRERDAGRGRGCDAKHCLSARRRNARVVHGQRCSRGWHAEAGRAAALCRGRRPPFPRCRHILNSEDVNNSLIMIQPTLMSYTFDTPPQPVLLDSVSIRPDVVLLLDTFFHILIFHGSTMAEWRKAGYHEQEGYENFKEVLEAPKTDAQDLLVDRFPVPRYIVCDQNGSQARFLLSKVNPSTTHMTANTYGAATGAIAMTDDVSLQGAQRRACDERRARADAPPPPQCSSIISSALQSAQTRARTCETCQRGACGPSARGAVRLLERFPSTAFPPPPPGRSGACCCEMYPFRQGVRCGDDDGQARDRRSWGSAPKALPPRRRCHALRAPAAFCVPTRLRSVWCCRLVRAPECVADATLLRRPVERAACLLVLAAVCVRCDAARRGRQHAVQKRHRPLPRTFARAHARALHQPQPREPLAATPFSSRGSTQPLLEPCSKMPCPPASSSSRAAAAASSFIGDGGASP
jgi:hypothetical protein